jgi:hypothetical protein
MNSEETPETPEAQAPKDDILDNLEKILEKDEFEEIKQRFETQLNLFPESTKLISCAHEIVFSVTANVLEENKEGQNVGSVELLSQTYHMPVPENKHYIDFVNAFMEFFEKTMAESYNEAGKNTANKETKNG